MGFLVNVGLEYLSLSRSTGSLSGGEAQRIRLATQIGSGLMGVAYILDEPSIGLHQRDNDKLLAALKNLRDLGNTLIVDEPLNELEVHVSRSHQTERIIMQICLVVVVQVYKEVESIIPRQADKGLLNEWIISLSFLIEPEDLFVVPDTVIVQHGLILLTKL